jgi:hypothetical protein
MDAVDADAHLGTVSCFFAGGSLAAILFFFRRAKPVSLALLGWWICFMGGFLAFAPGTISGSEDVAGWATRSAVAALVGLLAGAWLGSNVGAPTVSPLFLVGCAFVSLIIGAALITVLWLLSDVSCRGWVSAEHVRQGPDTTFRAATWS